MRDYKDEPFVIARSTFPRAYESTLSICRHAGFHPKIAHQVHSLYTQLILVSAGFGVALLPHWAKIVGTGVSFLPLAGWLPPVSLSLAPRKTDSSPILKAFLQLAHKSPTHASGA